VTDASSHPPTDALTPDGSVPSVDASRDASRPDAASVDAASAIGDAAPADVGTTEDVGPISTECRAYCECFEHDCAGIQGVPGGGSCAAFCATFTPTQWDCRISHCRLVVPEHNPNHCMHAVGIDQCL